jgi:hypothetical protein
LPSAIIIFLLEVGPKIDISVWLKRYIFFIKD